MILSLSLFPGWPSIRAKATPECLLHVKNKVFYRSVAP